MEDTAFQIATWKDKALRRFSGSILKSQGNITVLGKGHCCNLWIFSHKPSSVGLPVLLRVWESPPNGDTQLEAKGDLWRSDPSVCVHKRLCVLGEVVKNSSADPSPDLQFNSIHMTRPRKASEEESGRCRWRSETRGHQARLQKTNQGNGDREPGVSPCLSCLSLDLLDFSVCELVGDQLFL